MSPRSQRGSALLISMIVVLVIAVVGVAVIKVSSRELAGATASRQADALTACADAGRQLLLNQFKGTQVQPESITALNVPLSGSVSAVGGHVDDATHVQVDQVRAVPQGTFGSSRGAATDLTNIIGGLGNLGNGLPYRVLVHCVDGDRQLEVEFGLQFGI